MHAKRRVITVASVVMTLCCAVPGLRAQSSISEPHTVFYGKVLGTASARDFLVTEGQLVWTILRADGVAVTLQTSLYPLHGNTYSYRLNVPHSAIALGLSASAGGIPMPPVPQVNIHAEVKVDGQAAALLGPAGGAFTTEQLLRTSTYRMDLGLDRAAPDTDGDGIPDWWEDRYGLDKQDPDDAGDDFSGDGLSALDAYLRGLDPTRSAYTPALLTEDVVVYRSGTTAILLESVDFDSDASQRVYTLIRLPLAGTLTLRNAQADPASPDRILAVGGQFTQSDLQKGRLIYDHDGSYGAPGAFEVELRDENPAHPVARGTVNLLPYEPAQLMPSAVSALERRRMDNYFAAGRGYVIHDGTPFQANVALGAPSAGLATAALSDYIAVYGADRSYRLIGGAGVSAALAGGHQPDVLVAGPKGGSLTGGAGADVFAVKSFDSGLITITDFSLPEADVLDLSGIPAVPGAYVHHYLRLAKLGGVYHLQTDLDGNGTGFTNVMVALPGLTDADASFYKLIESGRLLAGVLQLEPMISVVASEPQASENGPSPGRFTVVRQGSLGSELLVNVAVGGTAQNGVDYLLVGPAVIMPAGAASVDVPIMPIADGIAEPLETVQLTVLAGTGYRLGAASQAVVTIEDLLMLVQIEAIDPVAVKDTAVPGRFRISRRDVTDTDVVVNLSIGGTASNGGDYNTISSLVHLVPNQTEAFLLVVPRADAVLAGGLETVDVSIRPDAGYRVDHKGSARVVIIERLESFAGWRARVFPDSTDDMVVFASADSGNRGVSHLQRYAFGLDPHDADRSGLPRALLHEGRLVVTFRRPLYVRDDIVYHVRGFTDLMNPAASAIPMVPISAPDGADDPEQVYYGVDGAAAAGANAVFCVIELKWGL